MRYEKKEGATHIYVEANEQEHEVLIAIIQASYALARPINETWDEFEIEKRGWILTEHGAQKYIDWDSYRKSEGAVVEMDVIHGRKCSTFISYVAGKHFLLDDETFEAFRGLSDTMFEVANRMMQGYKISRAPLTTLYAYEGESLTLRLRAMGFARLEAESDWDFRRRVFLDLHEKKSARTAWEFLFGRSFIEWDDYDYRYYHYFGAFWDSEKEEYRKKEYKPERVAQGFATDPMRMRSERARYYYEVPEESFD